MDRISKLYKLLHKLDKYNNSSFPILSVYIKKHRRAQDQDSLAQFEQLINRLSREEKNFFSTDIQIMSAFIQKNPNKNLAIFSKNGKLWVVVVHNYSLNPICEISHSPFIKPLLNALYKQSRYLILLADREKAIYFTLHQGYLEKFEVFNDPMVPQDVKSNKEDFYARNNIILRHIQDHLNRHLTKISHHIDDFIKGQRIQGVLIGGHKPLFRKIENHLNPLIKKKIIGKIVTELNIPQNELIKNSKSFLNNLQLANYI